MYLSLLTVLLSHLTAISATPLQRLYTKNNVTTLGEGPTQPGPILSRRSTIPLKPLDHFPSIFEIAQSINAYSMLLLECQSTGQGAFCDSPLNNDNEFLAYTGHLHDVLECHFRPGGKLCATSENMVLSIYKLFDYMALASSYPSSTSIPSSPSTAASSTISIPSSPSTTTFSTASVSLAPSPLSTSAILQNSTSLSSSTSLATTTSSSLVPLTSLTMATYLSTLTSRHTWISLSTVTSFLSTSSVPVPSVPSSTPSTSLSTSTVVLRSTVTVPSVPTSAPFFNGDLKMKRTVQRAKDSEREPLAQGKAAQPNQLNGTAAVPGNDSTSDTSSFERKGALPGIIMNAAANAIDTEVQDAIAEDEQEDAKNSSEGKDEKKELKITRSNGVASGNVPDGVFGVIGAIGVAQQEQNQRSK